MDTSWLLPKTYNALALSVSVFIVALGNQALFSNLSQAYPLTSDTFLFWLSLTVVLLSLTTIVLSLVCWKPVVKPILILVLVGSSLAAYVMDTYNVILDKEMLANTITTDPREIRELLSARLGAYILVLGIFPSVFVWRLRPAWLGWRKELAWRGVLIAGCLALLIAAVIPMTASYASFVREPLNTRYMANPVYWIRSVLRVIRPRSAPSGVTVSAVGLDARLSAAHSGRQLVIMVVGETVRADRFGLNGYGKDTTPLLGKANVVSFKDVRSCGTFTSISVPCMFSVLTRDEYDKPLAKSQENVLDILKRAGVNVLWRDNNSSSRGVADRVIYEDFRDESKNPVCDVECRDEGMLSGLDERIAEFSSGDILIVLHPLGSHGPLYYRRYPESFAQFLPACETNRLETCTKTELDNAYDNSILYADFFLDQVIDLLERHDGEFKTAMLYAGDHGESLGEGGVYLHGMPYMIAPEAQTHVPLVMWFGSTFGITTDRTREREDIPYSHDNIFHTLLGLMKVETSVYDPALDILEPSSQGPHTDSALLVEND